LQIAFGSSAFSQQHIEFFQFDMIVLELLNIKVLDDGYTVDQGQGRDQGAIEVEAVTWRHGQVAMRNIISESAFENTNGRGSQGMLGRQLAAIQLAETKPFDSVDVARGCPYLIAGFKFFNFSLAIRSGDVRTFKVAGVGQRAILKMEFIWV